MFYKSTWVNLLSLWKHWKDLACLVLGNWLELLMSWGMTLPWTCCSPGPRNGGKILFIFEFIAGHEIKCFIEMSSCLCFVWKDVTYVVGHGNILINYKRAHDLEACPLFANIFLFTRDSLIGKQLKRRTNIIPSLLDKL